MLQQKSNAFLICSDIACKSSATLIKIQGTLSIYGVEQFEVMPMQSTHHLNPKKLLLSKWTAVKPQNKEKHFIVTKLVEPELPNMPLEKIEIEAVYYNRSFIVPWRELTEADQWLQGWK